MNAEESNVIADTTKILRQLDRKSLLLINSGAKLLAARQDMDKDTHQECLVETRGR